MHRFREDREVYSWNPENLSKLLRLCVTILLQASFRLPNLIVRLYELSVTERFTVIAFNLVKTSFDVWWPASHRRFKVFGGLVPALTPPGSVDGVWCLVVVANFFSGTVRAIAWPTHVFFVTQQIKQIILFSLGLPQNKREIVMSRKFEKQNRPLSRLQKFESCHQDVSTGPGPLPRETISDKGSPSKFALEMWRWNEIKGRGLN